MAEATGISWCDSTFNPWIGCTKVSPACDHCYAERLMDHRMHKVQWGAGQPRQRTSAANWRQPLLWEREHEAFALAHDGRRRRVFCASLADVFDNSVDSAWRADLFALIESTPHLDWLLLTKRIGNAKDMIFEARKALLAPGQLYWPPKLPNIWLGATVVTQEEADRDIPKLLAVPAAKRFVSIEPMLGPLDLQRWLWVCCGDMQPGNDHGMLGQEPDHCCGRPDHRDELHWVIAGGESGPQARPMHPDWVRSLRDQCAAAGVPFHFKQWGEFAPYDRGAVDSTLLATPKALDGPMGRVGTKAAGRLLDGVEHNAFPS